MEIITKLSTLGICADETVPSAEDLKSARDAFIKSVFNVIAEEFIDKSASSGAYFYEDYSPEHYHFGALEPDYVKAKAKAWIQEIRKEFADALSALCDGAVLDGIVDVSRLPVDNDKTYRVANAARELDNNWFSYAEHSVYLENECGYSYFRVMLTDAETADIIAHPERYVVIDAYVKD